MAASTKIYLQPFLYSNLFLTVLHFDQISIYRFFSNKTQEYINNHASFATLHLIFKIFSSLLVQYNKNNFPLLSRFPLNSLFPCLQRYFFTLIFYIILRFELSFLILIFKFLHSV